MANVEVVSSAAVEGDEEFLDFYLGSTQEEAEETYYLFSNILNIISDAYAKNTGVDQEDLFGAALEGLARAKRDWNPSLGKCSFKSYAMFRMKTGMNTACRKKSVITIPEYIRVAHTYITNIKTILEGYNEEAQDIAYVLRNADSNYIDVIHAVDRERLKLELNKLEKLAKNSGVPYTNLIKRAEYIPTDYYLSDDMSQEELWQAERRRMAAALMVSKLQDKMTDSEIHITNGIMAGKSYGEIGRTHDPKRSIAWVKQQLDKMRERFTNDDNNRCSIREKT